jgi:hypothetical protein
MVLITRTQLQIFLIISSLPFLILLYVDWKDELKLNCIKKTILNWWMKGRMDYTFWEKYIKILDKFFAIHLVLCLELCVFHLVLWHQITWFYPHSSMWTKFLHNLFSPSQFLFLFTILCFRSLCNNIDRGINVYIIGMCNNYPNACLIPLWNRYLSLWQIKYEGSSRYLSFGNLTRKLIIVGIRLVRTMVLKQGFWRFLLSRNNLTLTKLFLSINV